MLRIVLLALTAALFYVANAHAHDVHAGCAYGPYHSGTNWHYHPGAYGQAVPCPPPGQGGGYGAPDYGPSYGPEAGGGGGYYRPGYGGGYPSDDDGYDDAPPPPPPGYYRRGYGGGYGRAPRPGDYGPQTNRAQDCYNVYGNRICCPKGWTVQNGQCQPYRGR
jgi:hypothetical protein